MQVISRGLIVVGLLIIVAGNLATYYGIHTAVNAMRDTAESGIGDVAWGMSSAYFYSFVSLFGCLLLVVGLVLTALRRKHQP
jgi:hypothetical protein